MKLKTAQMLGVNLYCEASYLAFFG